MKQMLFWILVFLIMACVVWGCSPSKAITGEIKAVNGREVEVQGKRFKIGKTAPLPLVGDTVTFTPTKNRKKINSKLIK
jgi:hypothetical protein